jgi:hypothetical protein
MPRNLRRTTVALLILGGCYSPNEDATRPMQADDDGDASTTAASGTMSATTMSATTLATSDDGVASTEPGDTTAPTEPGSSTDPGSSAGPADPSCGDGNIDPGEDCDDGEANALTAACRPDCNVATCGDGDIWAGVEGCDDGEGDNVLEVGACAPDCSRVIEERLITETSGVIASGDFGNNPVAFADSLCDAGSAAMFAYPNVREAALDPFDTSESIDWVLDPYTAYVNDDGDVVWITDDVPLLGVRDGAQQPLLVAVSPCVTGCVYRKLTGMVDGWLTRVENTCSLWSDGSPGNVAVGNAHTEDEFLDSGEFRDCSDFNGRVGVYCVEQ